MFAVIYQSYIKSGLEQEYQQLWNQIACYFVEHRSAIGSCLHKTADGMWLAYSRWPDKATRDAAWPGESTPCEDLPNEIRKAILDIRNCIDQNRKIPEVCLEVVDDLF